MDFLKALDEAKQQGISQEDFVKIWELEMKLKQQKEQTKILELQLACGKPLDSPQSQSTKDQVKSLLQNHLKDLQQQVCHLKNDIVQQISEQFHEISKQFESQAAVTAVVIRNEMEDALVQHAANANSEFFQNVQNAHGDIQQPSAGGTENDNPQKKQKKEKTPKQKQDTTPKQKQDESPTSTSHQWADSDAGGDGQGLFPSKDGAILCVKEVDQLITGAEVSESSLYILPDCPSRVQLTIWFSELGNLNARLSIFGVEEQHLKSSQIFTVSGLIENKNSGSYSSLFGGISQPLRKLRPNKEVQVNTTVCLKTAKGSYENVTLEELEKRTFVINNSLVIKWFVTTEEAQGDEASTT